MKQESDNFIAAADAYSREPRYAISLSFDDDDLDVIWLTSNDNTQLPAGTLAQDIIHGAINKRGISGKTQELNHATSESSIGSVTVKVTDLNRALSQRIFDKLATAQSLRYKRIRIYLGFDGLVWDDYVQVLTFIVDKVKVKNGVYTLTCNDIQRAVKEEIFTKHVTELATTITATDTVIPVTTLDPDIFPVTYHGLGYTFDQDQACGYFKIKNETIKHFGLNASGTQFEGVVRGALGTTAEAYTVDPNSKVEIEEYIAFEGIAAQWLYALHTGLYPGGENLLQNPFDVLGAGWAVSNATSALSLADAPLNWAKLFTIDDTNAAGQGHIHQSPTLANYASGDTYTVSVVVKHDPSINTNVAVRARFNGTASYCYIEARVNMATGAVSGVNSANATLTRSAGVRIGDYWFISAAGFCNSGDSTSVQFLAFPRVSTVETGPADFCFPFLGAGNVDGWHHVPNHWHHSVSHSYMAIEDFYALPNSLWDTLANTGKEVRFWNIDSETGKKFIAQEFLVWMSCFMPVYGDGRLGVKRRASTLPESSYDAHLTDADLISYGDLTYNYDKLINNISVKWNWLRNQERFSKVTQIVDSDSVAKYGKAPVREIELRGLATGSHSEQQLLQYFDSIRDSHRAPPVTLPVAITGKWARLDVGDTVRVSSSHIYDHNTNSAIDRAFEIQSSKIDWLKGQVSLKLFGGVEKSDLIRLNTFTNKLLDSFYTNPYAATDIATLPGAVIDGNGVWSSNHTFNGNWLRADQAVLFYDGDLEIAGTLTITDNVMIRCTGNIHISGKIDGKGGGAAGAPPTAGYNQRTSLGAYGGIGKPHAGGGLYQSTTLRIVAGLFESTVEPLQDQSYLYGYWPWHNVPHELELPELRNRDGSSLAGLNYNLRGSGGAAGQNTFRYGFGNLVFEQGQASGGAGGTGGAGLIIISRGLTFDGIAGEIDLSGTDGTTGGVVDGLVAGAGAGGWPGGCMIILDGSLITPNRQYIKLENGATPLNPAATNPVSAKVKADTVVNTAYNQKIGTQKADRKDTMLQIAAVPDAELYELFTEKQLEEQAADLSNIPSNNGAIEWSDISGTPNAPVDNANFVNNTNQLVDGAGLGITAQWPNVTGTGKPADNADVTLDQIGGSGVNIVEYIFGVFEAITPPAMEVNNGTYIVDDTQAYFGSKSLKLTATAADAHVFLGFSATFYSIRITPNKKWIMSAYVRGSVASMAGQMRMRTSDGIYHGPINFTTSATPGEWTRVSGALDTSLNASRQCLLLVDNDHGSGDIWFDGIMFEEQVGNGSLPSAYSLPPGQLALADLGAGDLAVLNTADFATQVTGPEKPANNADVTALNQAASISGQGVLATANTADFSTQVSGATKPADNADVTALNQAASISGQGTLATANTADFSTQVSGPGKPADNADVTALNQAASISGQGTLATANTADFSTQVSGPGKPANNADVTADNENHRQTFFFYQASETQPALPANGAGAYNFSTDVVTPPAGWLTEPPTATGTIWTTYTTFYDQGPVGVDDGSNAYVVPYKTDYLNANLKITASTTVTVGAAGDFASLPAALAFLSEKFPTYASSGITAEIQMLTGYVITEQLIVDQEDYSWVTITSVDTVVVETITTWTTLQLNEFDWAGGGGPGSEQYEMRAIFAAINGGKMPKIKFRLNCNFNGRTTDFTDRKYAAFYARGLGSQISVAPQEPSPSNFWYGAECLLNRNIHNEMHGTHAVDGGTINVAGGSKLVGFNYGFRANHSGRITGSYAWAENCIYAVYAQYGGEITIPQVVAKGATTALTAQYGGKIVVPNASDAGVAPVSRNADCLGGEIDMIQASLTNANTNSIYTGFGGRIYCAFTTQPISQTANVVTANGLIIR